MLFRSFVLMPWSVRRPRRVPLVTVLLALALLLPAPASAVPPASPRPPTPSASLEPRLLSEALGQAETLPRLQSLLIAQNGVTQIERVFDGSDADEPVNVKSLSKTVLSALVGIAVERGVLSGPDQRIGPLLDERIPADADPRVRDITIGNLLSMQAGLERTSGRNYGAWVTSDDWVGYALSRPFVDRPGGRMLYSTGNSHLLSAILTEATGESTLTLARDWLGEPLDFEIPSWTRDPQGVYMGGNNMWLAPQALLRIGELYRQGGVYQGRRILSEAWIRESWTPRTRSRFTGDAYGYGWFLESARGHDVFYGWGFGGQMLYVVPDLALTVVMTSESDVAGRDGFVRRLHDLLANRIVPAAEAGMGVATAQPPDRTVGGGA